MKNNLLNTALILGLLSFNSCGNIKTDGSESFANMGITATTSLDLTQKGIPLHLQAPIGAEIKPGLGMAEWDGVKTWNYEIVKDGFILDINMVDKPTEAGLYDFVSGAKSLAEKENGFDGIVKEEDNGFIYKISSNENEDYGFYYLTIKNNKAIEFSAGLNLFSEFTLNDIEQLYACAKSAE